MFSRFVLPALLSLVTLVSADPDPQEPGPGAVFNEGATCHIAWGADTTGAWKSMAIELMTGDNWNMVHLTTVATLDGTTATTYDYPCPDVTINAPIYFYQFTYAGSPSTRYWTTRFTIADASGGTVAAPNTTQPDGQKIGWGIGALTDPSTAVAAPSYLSSSSSAAASGSASGAASSAAASAASSAAATSAAASSVAATTAPASSAAATSSGLVTSKAAASSTKASSSATSSAASASGTPGSASTQTGSALSLQAFASRAGQATVALAVVAGTFTFF